MKDSEASLDKKIEKAEYEIFVIREDLNKRINEWIKKVVNGDTSYY